MKKIIFTVLAFALSFPGHSQYNETNTIGLNSVSVRDGDIGRTLNGEFVVVNKNQINDLIKLGFKTEYNKHKIQIIKPGINKGVIQFKNQTVIYKGSVQIIPGIVLNESEMAGFYLIKAGKLKKERNNCLLWGSIISTSLITISPQSNGISTSQKGTLYIAGGIVSLGLTINAAIKDYQANKMLEKSGKSLMKLK